MHFPYPVRISNDRMVMFPLNQYITYVENLKQG